MKTHLMMTAAALALAACGSSADKGDGNGTAAASGGGGGGAAGVSLQPGEWEMKMEVLDVKAEGLPAGMAETMKKSAGNTSKTCMTPEDAKGPKGDIFAGDKSGSCKSEGFKWAGGRIAGKTTCPGQGGTGDMVMTMNGTYSPQNIDMTMKTQTDMMGKPMTMEMRVSGRRVGECTASTKGG
ncbi:MAG TPA: DUF3617 domain-containing protein [Allosphingosinicella sp.]|nr:DUF3617 domain-containing protein [Allosphingosinicella sp.]